PVRHGGGTGAPRVRAGPRAEGPDAVRAALGGAAADRGTDLERVGERADAQGQQRARLRTGPAVDGVRGRGSRAGPPAERALLTARARTSPATSSAATGSAATSGTRYAGRRDTGGSSAAALARYSRAWSCAGSASSTLSNSSTASRYRPAKYALSP